MQKGLNYDLALSKMRLATLCSLAETQMELPYQAVAAALKLENNDDLEEKVIEWTVSGQIEARLDQEKQIVHVL